MLGGTAGISRRRIGWSGTAVAGIPRGQPHPRPAALNAPAYRTTVEESSLATECTRSSPLQRAQSHSAVTSSPRGQPQRGGDAARTSRGWNPCDSQRGAGVQLYESQMRCWPHTQHARDQEPAAGLQPRAKDTKSCGLAQSAPVGVLSSALLVSKPLHLSPKILAATRLRFQVDVVEEREPAAHVVLQPVYTCTGCVDIDILADGNDQRLVHDPLLDFAIDSCAFFQV